MENNVLSFRKDSFSACIRNETYPAHNTLLKELWKREIKVDIRHFYSN